MKIGILANYLTFRYDLRKFIDEFSKKNDVVIFINEEQTTLIPDSIEKRLIDFKLSGFFNRLWKKSYGFFGINPIPNNYYLFAFRKLFIRKGKGNSLKFKIEYFLTKYAPKILTFDFYLDKLVTPKYPIDDIDIFLVFTPHEEDIFLSAISKTDKPIIAYIHSWDHIAKMKKTTIRRFRYLTWNEELKKDLIKFFNVSSGLIKSVGSTQLSLIDDFLKNSNDSISSQRKKSKPYFYFVASFGEKDAAAQEVELIKHLSKIIWELDKNVELVIRPYPMLSLWELYEVLKNEPNIKFDEYISSNRKVLLDKTDIYGKFANLKEAELIIHTGTTVGMESCYLDKQVIYINYLPKSVKSSDHIISLDEFWKQYHLKKYFFHTNFPNVVKNEMELRNILELCRQNDTEGLTYSSNIKKYTELKSIEKLADCFKKAIEDFRTCYETESNNSQ